MRVGHHQRLYATNSLCASTGCADVFANPNQTVKRLVTLRWRRIKNSIESGNDQRALAGAVVDLRVAGEHTN